jgi:hypothetical protein
MHRIVKSTCFCLVIFRTNHLVSPSVLSLLAFICFPKESAKVTNSSAATVKTREDCSGPLFKDFAVIGMSRDIRLYSNNMVKIKLDTIQCNIPSFCSMSKLL